MLSSFFSFLAVLVLSLFGVVEWRARVVWVGGAFRPACWASEGPCAFSSVGCVFAPLVGPAFLWRAVWVLLRG